MSYIKRSLVSSGVVLVAVGAVVAGNHFRNTVELGDVQNVGQVKQTAEAPLGENVVAFNAPAIPETNYFEAVTELLKAKYVDPVTDDKKLVGGAIRGMLLDLNDPNSIYMDANEYRAFVNARAGRYEGIGVELIMALSPKDKEAADKLQSGSDTADEATDSLRIPRLTVALVVPGGPADRAGVKAGDWVDSVDGKWVVNAEPLLRLRDLQLKVQKGQAKPEELNKMRDELRAKSKASMLPGRAKDHLTIGKTGTVSVTWAREGKLIPTQLTKGLSRMPDVSTASASGPLRIRFIPGEAKMLKQAVAGRSQVVLDLRGNVMGDFESMKACLAVFAPAGTYGYVTREKAPLSTPLSLSSGNPRPPKITLLVDSGTRSVAEIFALSLSSKGLAKLSGNSMADDRTICEVVSLEDGSGYTLAIGKFSVAKPNSGVKKKKVAFGEVWDIVEGGSRAATLGNTRYALAGLLAWRAA